MRYHHSPQDFQEEVIPYIIKMYVNYIFKGKGTLLFIKREGELSDQFKKRFLKKKNTYSYTVEDIKEDKLSEAYNFLIENLVLVLHFKQGGNTTAYSAVSAHSQLHCFHYIVHVLLQQKVNNPA